MPAFPTLRRFQSAHVANTKPATGGFPYLRRLQAALLMKDFREEKHQRDDDGKFTSGGGATAVADKPDVKTEGDWTARRENWEATTGRQHPLSIGAMLDSRGEAVAATPALSDRLKTMGLGEIASIARRDWSRQGGGMPGKGVNYAAQPYLSAMSGLNSIDDDYGADPGRQIVAYFLSNASSWRGDTAKQVKAELKSRLKKTLGDEFAPVEVWLAKAEDNDEPAPPNVKELLRRGRESRMGADDGKPLDQMNDAQTPTTAQPGDTVEDPAFGDAGGDLVTRLPRLSLGGLARIVDKDWEDMGAVPRLWVTLLWDLRGLDDKIGYGDGRSMLNQFLLTAAGWRGETAKQVKAEMRRRLKG